MPDKKPLASFSFYVEVQGKLVGRFQDVAGLGSESDVIDYKASEKGGAELFHKVPGRLKWQDITLKRGITDDMDLWNWRREIEEGRADMARRNGSIVMYGQDNMEVARWNFENGWPSKVTGPSLSAKTNEIGIEELIIVHEGLRRTK